MIPSVPDDPRDFVLGASVGVTSLLIGLVLAAIAVVDRVDVLDVPVVVGGLIGVALAFGVVGFYDIVARGQTRHGTADLTSGAAVVLALLALYGNTPRWFVAVGSVVLVLSGVYLVARATGVTTGADEPATDVESEGAT